MMTENMIERCLFSVLPAKVVMEHATLYEEYLDEIDPNICRETTIGWHNNAREAIHTQLVASGFTRTLYNRTRNLNIVN